MEEKEGEWGCVIVTTFPSISSEFSLHKPAENNKLPLSRLDGKLILLQHKLTSIANVTSEAY